MQDKLTKTGHKKFYYRMKTGLTVLLFSIAVAAVAAIPVGITYRLAEVRAQEAETSHVSKETTTEEESVETTQIHDEIN